MANLVLHLSTRLPFTPEEHGLLHISRPKQSASLFFIVENAETPFNTLINVSAKLEASCHLGAKHLSYSQSMCLVPPTLEGGPGAVKVQDGWYQAINVDGHPTLYK